MSEPSGGAVPTTGSLTFIGTATTLLDVGGLRILTDPNFLHRGQRAWLGKGLTSRRLTEPAMRPADLPALDAIVLSHLHGDHWDRVARRGLDKRLPVVTTPHAARRLGVGHGFHKALGLRTWEQWDTGRDGTLLTVTALPGIHARGVLGRLLPPVMGSLLEFRSSHDARPLRIYITGDTLYDEGLREIRDRYEFDIALVHLGGTRVLGALVTMDARQGVDLLELVHPPRAVPIHYDDYSAFRSPLADFTAEAERRGWADRVTYVERGMTVQLAAAA